MWTWGLYVTVTALLHVPTSLGRWDHQVLTTFIPLGLCSCCSLCHECPSPMWPLLPPDPPVRTQSRNARSMQTLPPPLSPGSPLTGVMAQNQAPSAGSQCPACQLWASPCCSLPSGPYLPAVLRVGTTECVSNGQKNGWMDAWMNGGRGMDLPGYCHPTLPWNAFLWYSFLLLVPFIDSSNIY